MPRPLDPTRRFSNRVDDYVRYRPGYPAELVATLEREAGLRPTSKVADLGSGTGISAELFLDAVAAVFAVEPNADMRRAAEERLDGRRGFVSVAGTAEATTLPEASVDLVTAGQAFHWFDRARTRREMARILRPGGRVALFWNRRLVDETPFLRGYEELLLTFGTDYRRVDHRRVDHEALAAFFGGPFTTHRFPNRQLFDLEGLKGRLLSSSYVPAATEARHGPMLEALTRLFTEHQEAGRVDMLYQTELHFGPLA